MGRRPDIAPSAHQVPLAAGDCLIVACDGLHAHFDGPVLAEVLRQADPPTAALARHLVELADRAGGSDNCTVVVILCQ